MRQLPDVSSPQECDRTEFSAAPDLPGVEVMRVNAPARMWRWYHETYSVGTPIVPMRAEWKYRNRLHRTQPVTVALMEPGEIHAEVRKLDDHEAFRALLISPDLMHDAAAEAGVASGAVHWGEAMVHDQDVFRACLGLHAALERDGTALERQTRFARLAERLLGDFCERRPLLPGPPGEPAAVRQARELLQERWAENVQLDELVAASGVGRFHLIRAFHATVGLPPHAYQIRIRVARAMTLIRVGMPLVEVALRTGFADQSHLTRHFARVVGVSPGRYRQAVR
jgi:AraC-like DNA-binding protein